MTVDAKMTLTEKIKNAFENGADAIVVGVDYGDIRISRKRGSYKAELLERDMQMSCTANSPIEAVCGLRPHVRERRASRRSANKGR